MTLFYMNHHFKYPTSEHSHILRARGAETSAYEFGGQNISAYIWFPPLSFSLAIQLLFFYVFFFFFISVLYFYFGLCSLDPSTFHVLGTVLPHYSLGPLHP